MPCCRSCRREVVENKGWATDEELTDYFAIGQCTPGVIAVNTATFIGQKRRASSAASWPPWAWCSRLLSSLRPWPGSSTRFPSGLGAARLCRDQGVRVRADFQRRAEAVEGRGEGRVGPGDLPGDPGTVGVHQALALIYVLAAAVAGLLIKNLGAKRS